MNTGIFAAINCMLSLLASAAFGADTSVLKPPPGAKVAIIEFEDLECPQCARTSPLVHQAVETYHIPWARHDFPLPQHTWSFDAAVIARYFDTKSKKLGDGFRDYCYKNQLEITAQNLRQMAEQYAAENKVELPFVIDPLGKFAAQVKEFDLGKYVKNPERWDNCGVNTRFALAAAKQALADAELLDERLGDRTRMGVYLGSGEGIQDFGGLVEGVWPPTPRVDPWLSRPMRHELGLDLLRGGFAAGAMTRTRGGRDPAIRALITPGRVPGTTTSASTSPRYSPQRAEATDTMPSLGPSTGVSTAQARRRNGATRDCGTSAP